MNKIIFGIILAFFSFIASGRSRFNLPIYLDANGEVRIIERGSSDFTVGPVFQMGFEKSFLSYILPRKSSSFALLPVRGPASRFQIETKRKEYGIGLRYSGSIKLGLVPYRGSYQTTTHFIDTGPYLSSTVGIPQRLDAIEEWSVLDEGSYQTYGGLFLTAGVGIFEGIGANLNFEIMSGFTIGIKKNSSDKITLTITEESNRRRTLRLGTTGMRYSTSFLQSKLLHLEFALNLRENLHAELYQKILRGDIQAVQRALPWKAQKLSFTERKKSFSIGISQAAGETRTWSTFHYPEEDVYLKTKRSKGILVKSRTHQNYAFCSDQGISLLWTSKMKKVNGEAFWKHFLKRAELFKLAQFNTMVSFKMKLGSIETQMGVTLRRSDLVRLSKARLARNFDPKARKHVDAFLKLLEGPWEKNRLLLGKTLIDKPKLLPAILKELEGHEKVYFKFLSSEFQSLEGATYSVL